MMTDRTDITGETFHDDLRGGLRGNALPGDVIKRLSRLDPVRSSLALSETFGLIALCIAAALTWWHPLVIVPAIVIIGTRQQALVVLAHDATHYRLFERRWLNDLVGRLCGVISGISMCTYRVVHRLHHNHLYEAQDPDIPLHGGYPRGRAYLIKKLLKDLCGLTAWKTYGYFFGAPAANTSTDNAPRPLDDTSPRLRAAALRDRWLVVAFHVTAPLVAIAAGYGVEYIVLWVLPLVTVLQALLRLRAVCEHGAVHDFGSPMTAARTNLAPGPVGWLLFPHHVNYHIEHHSFPAIPHYNLPSCHRELQARRLLDRAEVRPVGETFGLIFADRQTETAPA